MREAPDELEADLQEQGLWLGDMWSGEVSVRRLSVVASQLRPGSRVWQALKTDAMWTPEQYMAATLIDAVNLNSWISANYGVEEGKQSPRPELYPRPGDLREEDDSEARMSKNARLMAAALSRKKETDSGD